ncbi:MAG: HAD-IIB family hydrolase [Candidatus Microsaccharimonas sossegonensis]|uniref:HAD-IIB family hydrolase n=1 Tax=Candidatus Microsaccharimonas sossegonensis TaxID=2506948 RepID=A0A4Q0AGY1_9BACT|nr:MAG: HAD-IIB family hydrolase [Candidatus Microsaccharimonas sossegonensis]
MKKVLAFDLDGTLAPSKSSLPPQVGKLLDQLLDYFDICVISGGKFGQFETQLLKGLKSDATKLSKLHLMPTCGTQYYKFNGSNWDQIYAENFTDDEKSKIIAALNEGIDMLGYRESKVYGEIIEDRGSQITFSALGQDIVTELGDEGIRLKEEWDPDSVKKNSIRDYVAKLIPEFEVRVGGGTSIDITKPGIDKAYGMQKLIDMLSITKEDILFFGDRLAEGGNDYPVKEFGIDTLEVSGWEHTSHRLETVYDAIK